MRANPLNKRLQAGEIVYGTMIQDVRSPSIGQIMQLAGCDFLFFDMEHGPFDIGSVGDMIKVTRLTGLAPLVRVPDIQYHLIARVLDAGAMGFMVPRIETREQVERIVESALFPPKGNRGCSVDKGHNDFSSQNMWEFTEQANRENLIILQIERKRAMEDLDDILSVEGVGAIILGPNDLALSIGERSQDMLGALEPYIQQILDVAKAHKIPCGIHIGNLDWLIEWQHRGMQIMTYSKDITLLLQGAKAGITKLREAATT